MELDETVTAVAENTFASCIPTNRKAPDNSVVQRNNFAKRHDRKPFSRTKRRHHIGRNGRRIKNIDDDEQVREEEPTKKGEANPELTNKHKISENSNLEYWFKTFLENKLNRTHKHSTNAWNACANMKGLLSIIGYEGQLHQGFKDFSPMEMMAFIGLIMLNSLTLRMRLHKFKTQQEDPVAANDLRARIF